MPRTRQHDPSKGSGAPGPPARARRMEAKDCVQMRRGGLQDRSKHRTVQKRNAKRRLSSLELLSTSPLTRKSDARQRKSVSQTLHWGAASFMHGEAFLAGTSIGRELGDAHRVKVRTEN